MVAQLQLFLHTRTIKACLVLDSWVSPVPEQIIDAGFTYLFYLWVGLHGMIQTILVITHD